jgi:hypothetical protein
VVIVVVTLAVFVLVPVVAALAVIVVIVRVAVVMIVPVVVPAVGAAFRVKRRVLEAERNAETTGEVVEHVVVAIRQPPRFHFERDVAITEVIGDAGEQQSVTAPDHAERLRLCFQQDGRPVFGLEPLAGFEVGPAREQHRDFLSVRQPAAQATLLACIVVEPKRTERAFGRLTTMNRARGVHRDQNRK